MIPRTWRAHKAKNAVVIQRYMRGYYVFHKMNEDIRAKKFDINYEFFKDMRLKLCNDAQHVVSGVFRRWWDRLPAERKNFAPEVKLEKKPTKKTSQRRL